MLLLGLYFVNEHRLQLIYKLSIGKTVFIVEYSAQSSVKLYLESSRWFFLLLNLILVQGVVKAWRYEAYFARNGYRISTYNVRRHMFQFA